MRFRIQTGPFWLAKGSFWGIERGDEGRLTNG